MSDSRRLSSVLLIVLIGLPFAHAVEDPLQKNVAPELVDRLEAAQAKRAAGDVNGAISDFRSILAENPTYYRAEHNLGLAVADAAGDDKIKLEQAITILESARQLVEQQSLSDYSIYNSLGWSYQQANRRADAEKAYNEALKHEATNTEDTNRRLYTNVGVFYLQGGDLENARKYLNIALTKYHSDSARKFLEISDSARQKTSIPPTVAYQAKLSLQDKKTSKGIPFVDRVRSASGPEAALLEVVLQDRANFYSYRKRDPEDQASPGLESTIVNRVEFQRRKLQLDGITTDDCLNAEPIVRIMISKDTLTVSRPQS
jgi:tetratricopeptide (TPR) repeat protein